MGRWGNAHQSDFLPHPLPRPADRVYVATYTVAVELDIVHAELRFNESLHPDEILKALLVDDWGSLKLTSWPPAGCTEQNRFRLLALQKISIFLDMAEYVQAIDKPERPRAPDQPDPPERPRAWAYTRFPAVRAALEAGLGPYRRCIFEARIATRGLVIHDYYIPDEGTAPPGLAGDRETLIFVRALAQTDLYRRVAALLE